MYYTYVGLDMKDFVFCGESDPFSQKTGVLSILNAQISSRVLLQEAPAIEALKELPLYSTSLSLTLTLLCMI